MGLSTDAVLQLMQEVAAEVITPRFRALAHGEVMEKNPGDLVTVADREAEVLIARALAAAYPNAVVLGEEAHGLDRGIMGHYLRAEHAFTVDPVDGTKNFVHGSVDHAVMVGEVRSGEAVRAWIWQPEHQVSWVAERGGGVRRNGETVVRGPVATPPRVVTSMRRLVGTQVGDYPPLELSWVCCGVDYPRLLEGAADAILYGHANPWDHTPGGLMVREAGGMTGHVDGSHWSPLSRSPGLVVTATPDLFAALQPLVETALRRGRAE